MSEEIKDVLDSIKEAINKNDDSIDSFLIDIECWKELLDYITNLQEENKELLLELSGYREAILKNDDLLGLQDRIDKAIDYIEIIQYNESYGVKEKDYLKLLDILKGG